MKNNYSTKQLDYLRHMLGINDPSKKEPVPYRNYAAVGEGDLELFKEMEKLGLVEQFEHRDSQYVWYRCTDEGKKVAIRSFKKIRLPKSKRRYLKYLSVADCYSDLTFKEFLTLPEFAEHRKEA